jgi:hypothetical protein
VPVSRLHLAEGTSFLTHLPHLYQRIIARHDPTYSTQSVKTKIGIRLIKTRLCAQIYADFNSRSQQDHAA